MGSDVIKHETVTDADPGVDIQACLHSTLAVQSYLEIQC